MRSTGTMGHSPKSPAKFAGLCLALGLATASCGVSNQDVSAVKHDEDAPTRATESWMWMSVTNAQFEASMSQLFGIRSTDYLASSNPLTKRAQLWLDRFDAQLRAAQPEALANVPKPHAKVVRDGSANAFVAPIPVCYKLPVKVRSGTANASNTAKTIYLDNGSGEVSDWPSNITCYNGPNDVATMKSFVSTFNASNMACQLSVSQQGALVLGSGCSVDSSLDGVVAAKNVAIFQTANYVTIHTGLFPLMTEASFASVLAHELGHYYRSHSTATSADYDFFYTAQQDQPNHRPVRENDKQDLGESAIASSTLLATSDSYRNFDGAIYRPELFFAAGSLVVAACDAGSCPTVCDDAKTLIESASFDTDIGVYPFGGEGPSEAQAYAGFEAKVGACLQQLEVSATPGTVSATAISWDKVKESIQDPAWPTWLGQLSRSTQESLAQMAALTALRLGDDAPATTTLQDLLAKASKDLNDQDEASVGILKQAVTDHLAYYTSEQEADEEAAEWVSETGLDAQSVVEAMASLGKGSATSMRGQVLGERDCMTLKNNDWMDADGGYVFVPVGDYAEVHHSVCYRMFNLDREIKGHGYVTASTTPPLLSETDWQVLQAKAISLSEAIESGNDDRLLQSSAVSKRLKAVMSCPYASKYH